MSGHADKLTVVFDCVPMQIDPVVKASSIADREVKQSFSSGLLKKGLYNEDPVD